ncbi:MAG: sulfite exporter TauE/SafE family protein [Ignavibacteriaceae bacterium]|nr:sulfite exporter TauE/SafE family protein [Ignavibacteriaceae bacterium]
MILSYIFALMVGVVLGLLGAGGSILAIPILRYGAGLDPVTATAYSMFVVGMTALAGSAGFLKEKKINYRAVLIFSLISIPFVWLTRQYFIYLIPEKVFEIQGMMVGRNLIIMTIFGVAMIAASVSMIKGSAPDESLQNEAVPYLKLVVTAVILGLFTGIVGAGGGFMIVPALVLILKIPVKDAIGTSLLIIAVNTLIGFTGNIGKVEIDWAFLIPFALVMIAGTVPGIYLNKKIPAKKIKPVFGWFLLAMGVYTLVKEIFLTK